MLDEDDRRALELVAYGGTASAEKGAAARRALESDDAERARETSGDAVTAGASPIDTTQDEARDDVGLPAPVASRRPRARLLVIAAAALVVGAAGGVAVDMAVRPTITVVPPPSVASALATDGDSRFNDDPSVVASSREKILAAEALLAQTATSVDPYPETPGANVTYVPSSTRLVATTPSKTRVWIAREAGSSGGYCLLSLDPSDNPNTGLGLASCSLPGEFTSSGVTLSANGYDVTWKGGRVTVALGN